MPVPILPTKLYMPPPRADLVPRPRLLDRLDEGLLQGRSLSVISAPAGFGKTTLVTSWLYSANRPVASRAAAWVSLDEGDNDPARWIAHVIAALQQVDGTIGRASPGTGLLRTPQVVPLDATVAGLIRELVNVDTGFVLVLDDYHLIEAPEIHRAIDFLVNNQPPTMHLVVTSRDEPPFSLPRLRVQRKVTEITAQDLRFTEGEVAQFLQQAKILSLCDEEVAAVAARTEGWIAGLRLLTLAMLDDEGRLARQMGTRSSPAATGEPLEGTRYVADYLVAEVLARQPEAVQSFLKTTSVLDHLTASLCDALTGRTDSDELLSKLEEQNLFLIPLDDRRQWFRYHRLFREVLHGMLGTQQDVDLHRRAMRWYEREGMPDYAVDHALVAAARTGETADAERLILATAEETAARGEVLTVRRWLDALPETRIRTNGELCTYRSWILAMTGDLPEAGEYVEIAERLFQVSRADSDKAPYPPHSLGKLRALQSFIVLLNDQAYDLATLYAEEALSLLPNDATQWAVLALWAKAEALERLNRATEAIETLREARRLSRTMHEVLFGIVAEGGLVKLLNDRGRRLEAVAACWDALHHYANAKGEPLPFAGFIFSHLGALSYEANELAEAQAFHDRARSVGEYLGLEYEAIYERALAAPTWHAIGEVDRALSALRDGYQHAIEKGYADADWFLAWEANIHLWQGDYVFAGSWAERAHLSPQDPIRLLRIEQHVTYGRVLISQRRLDDARHWLTRLAAFVREHDLARWEITARLLQAVVADRVGDRRSALDYVAGAIRLAGPQSYVRAFLQEGPRVLALLPQLRGVDPGFVDRVLRDGAAITVGDGGPLPLAPSGLIEPLTERETEVLHLIARGRSNRDIAEDLVIAVGTVKRHINNIYSKLQVGRRTEAVARARELGIV